LGSRPNDRIFQVAAFVESRLKQIAEQQNVPESRLEYRWRHTQRVANIGKELAAAEGANLELVIAACLLHDLAVFDPGEPRDHGRLAAQIAYPHLVEIGYSQAEAENICYSVASHVDLGQPETIEAMVVMDADNIDRFGPLRMIEFCLPEFNDYEKLIDKLGHRIPTLERYASQKVMQTDSGQAMFQRNVRLQLSVYQAMLEQYQHSFTPGL
jgi:hypothetical protein